MRAKRRTPPFFLGSSLTHHHITSTLRHKHIIFIWHSKRLSGHDREATIGTSFTISHASP